MGALNNLYVSSSFQGLMKLTNSATGLTNSLQTIQAGDGSDSPLQMSLTQVNISGSFTVNNLPITGSTSGTAGTSGTSGTSGSSGSNGTSGTSGSNGSSGTSGSSGSNGSSGTSGINGTSGTSGFNGSSGTSGQQGPSGSSGTSGINGSSGTSGSNGSSGTSGSNGTDGSSGTSGASGSSGSAGSDGSSGTSGSNGSDGSSGTSGNDGLGLPSKVIPLDATGWSWDSVFSRKTITFAQPFASSDYSVDIIYNTASSGDELPYYDMTSVYQIGYSGKSASGLTIYTSIDLTSSFYSGFTGYINCIAAGSSNGSGSSGTSGTSGLTDKTGLITTGSLGTEQAITGALDLLGGDLFIINSGTTPFNYTSSLGGSTNVLFGWAGSPLFPAAQQTGSIEIIGSNNILLNKPLDYNDGSSTTGFGTFISGSGNIFTSAYGGIVWKSGSAARPLSNNNFGAGTIQVDLTTSSLQQPTIQNNILIGGGSMNHQSGSFALQNNVLMGNLQSNQNNITSVQRPLISGNIIGTGIILNHVSSSIIAQNNIFNSQGATITNHFSSSLNTAANARIDVLRNITNGFQNNLYVSGAGSSNNVRQFTDNLIGGRSNIISSSYVGTNNAGVVSNIIYGQNLHVSGSNLTTGGSAFFGRFNATGSLQESTAETVFVVGTGTAGNARRNAIQIDSNNNTRITGSVTISGSLVVNGQSVVTDRNGLINTGSFLGAEQSISGSLTLSNNNSNNTMLRVTGGILTSGSINNMNFWRGPGDPGQNLGIGFNTLTNRTTGIGLTAIGSSVLANNTTGGDNTAIGGNALSNNTTGNDNVAIGTSAMLNNISGSFNVALGGNTLQNNVASVNIAIGSSALRGNTTGDLNTAIGRLSLTNNTTGGANTAIGATSLQSLTIGGNNIAFGYDSQFFNQSGSNNISIGNTSLYTNVSGSGNISIGNNAGRFETGSDAFYLDNQNRGSLNAMRSGSLLYGTFNSAVSGQTLQINAATDIRNNLVVSGSLSVGGNLQFNVGAFQSTQTQSGSANVSQSITYNTTDYSQGVTYVSGSRLTVANKGVYNIQFSAQIDRVAGSGTDTVHIWLKKNGTNLAGSAGSITISGGAAAAKTISSWNYVVDSAANDYYELVWEPTDSNIQLIAAGATGNIPSIPSIITTVTQVR
jgi:hypothetical protein